MLKKLLHATLIGLLVSGGPVLAADDSPPTSYIHGTNLGSGTSPDDSPPSGYAHITNAPAGGAGWMLTPGTNATAAALDNIATNAGQTGGLNTTDTPQFGRIGIGQAAQAGYSISAVNNPIRLLGTTFDQSGEVINLLSQYGVHLTTGNNSNDAVNVQGLTIVNPSTFHFTSQHTSGMLGYAYGDTTSWSGTVDMLSGVIGGAGNLNLGAGAVTQANSFLARPTFTATGPVTNYYAYFDQNVSACGATNCYGLSTGNPSIIGNAGGANIPTAGTMLDVRGVGQNLKGGSALPANSGTTQSAGWLYRFNDNSSAVLDVGGNGGSGYWLQAANQNALGTHYPLLLNPNGGTVNVGGPLIALSGFIPAETTISAANLTASLGGL